jgi:hypothetical protein
MRDASRSKNRSRSLLSDKPSILSLSEIDLRAKSMKTIEHILTDFFDTVEKRRRAAIKANRPPPSIIRDLDDLAKICEILSLIGDEAKSTTEQARNQADSSTAEKLVEDPEYRDLLVKLYRRKCQLEGP